MPQSRRRSPHTILPRARPAQRFDPPSSSVSYGAAARVTAALPPNRSSRGCAQSGPRQQSESRAGSPCYNRFPAKSPRLFKRARVEPGHTGVRTSASGLRLSDAFTTQTGLNHLHAFSAQKLSSQARCFCEIVWLNFFLRGYLPSNFREHEPSVPKITVPVPCS